MMTAGRETEDEMTRYRPGPTSAELTAAATMQTEATAQRLVFMWGQVLFTELRRVWAQLDTEPFATLQAWLSPSAPITDNFSSASWNLKLRSRDT